MHRLLTILIVLAGCGASSTRSAPTNEPATADTLSGTEATPQPVLDRAVPSADETAEAEQAAAPTARVPCAIWESVPLAGRGFEHRQVDQAEGPWLTGHAPRALSRAELLAMGATDEAPFLVVTQAPNTTLRYWVDGSDRTTNVGVTRGRRVLGTYEYLYDCQGALVEAPNGNVSRCRAIFRDGVPHVVCLDEELDLACTTSTRADVTDAPGEEEVFACEMCDAETGSHAAHVLTASGNIVWAVRGGQDSACEVLTPTPARGRSPAGIHLVGGGEDGGFDVQYVWRDSAMRIVRARFESALN